MIFRITDKKKLILAAIPILGLLAFLIIRYVDFYWVGKNDSNTILFGFALLVVCLIPIALLSKLFLFDYNLQIIKVQFFITKNNAPYINIPVNEIVMLKVLENNKSYTAKIFNTSGKVIFEFNNAFTKKSLSDVLSFFKPHIELITCNDKYLKMGGRTVDYINKTHLK